MVYNDLHNRYFYPTGDADAYCLCLAFSKRRKKVTVFVYTFNHFLSIEKF